MTTAGLLTPSGGGVKSSRNVLFICLARWRDVFCSISRGERLPLEEERHRHWMSTNVENLPFSVVCPFLKCSSLDGGVWLDGSNLLFFMKNVHIFLHTCDTLNTENITCLLTVKVKKQLLETWINQLTPLPPWIYEITKEEGKETIVPCKGCSVASNPTDPVIGHGL